MVEISKTLKEVMFQRPAISLELIRKLMHEVICELYGVCGQIKFSIYHIFVGFMFIKTIHEIQSMFGNLFDLIL